MTQEKGRCHFPGVRVKPLCHLSTCHSHRTDALRGQVDSDLPYRTALRNSFGWDDGPPANRSR
jgi:hypothetical protein